jgi:hypothetical protein
MAGESLAPEARNKPNRAEKQIAQRAAQQIGDAPLRQVVRAIMDHVAALAQALEIGTSAHDVIVVDHF